jgi:hypothetical protein
MLDQLSGIMCESQTNLALFLTFEVPNAQMIMNMLHICPLSRMTEPHNCCIEWLSHIDLLVHI